MPLLSASLEQAMARIDAFLTVATPERWLHAAPGQLEVLLSDHANCEKKAASTALSLCYRYDFEPVVLKQLSRLAREELRHFEQVLDLMAEEQIAYRSVSASGYAQALRAGISPTEPLRLIDTLLVCAIVEARSCERFGRLAPRLSRSLQRFYERLLASEARHFELYLDLARTQATRLTLPASTVEERLFALLERDRQAVLEPAVELRFHSGPPSAASSSSGSAAKAATA